MKKNNKGFTLVELIIVIAIMAILVAVMAPQMLKYIEKSKVTSDRGLLDTVYNALVIATSDPDVALDPDSGDEIATFSSPKRLQDINPDTLLYKEICNTIGWDNLNPSTYEPLLRSRHGSDCEIWFQYDGKCKNPVYMWITKTDRTGGGDISDSGTTPANLETRKVIAIY